MVGTGSEDLDQLFRRLIFGGGVHHFEDRIDCVAVGVVRIVINPALINRVLAAALFEGSAYFPIDPVTGQHRREAFGEAAIMHGVAKEKDVGRAGPRWWFGIVFRELEVSAADVFGFFGAVFSTFDQELLPDFIRGFARQGQKDFAVGLEIGHILDKIKLEALFGEGAGGEFDEEWMFQSFLVGGLRTIPHLTGDICTEEEKEEGEH